MPEPTSQRILEFRRRIDGVTYRWHPCESRNGLPAWKRADADVRLAWQVSHGWVVIDSQGQILGIPWAIALHAQTTEPPAGIWVSRKADKAYVYDCVYV